MVAPLPETMRAAYVERLGLPEAIAVGELAVPIPGPTDVLVAVELAAANPVDTLVRSGRYPTSVPFPFVVGRDLVGTAAARGHGAPFDVSGSGCGPTASATTAARAVSPPTPSYRPSAATASPTASTRRSPLRWRTRRRPLTSPCSSTATCEQASARPADHDRCREAGAEDVLDYRDPDLARRLRGAVPDGVDLFWETSGHHDLDLAAGALAPRGRVILSAATEELPVLPVRDLYTRDVSLHGFVISRATVSERV